MHASRAFHMFCTSWVVRKLLTAMHRERFYWKNNVENMTFFLRFSRFVSQIRNYWQNNFKRLLHPLRNSLILSNWFLADLAQFTFTRQNCISQIWSTSVQCKCTRPNLEGTSGLESEFEVLALLTLFGREDTSKYNGNCMRRDVASWIIYTDSSKYQDIYKKMYKKKEISHFLRTRE